MQIFQFLAFLLKYLRLIKAIAQLLKNNSPLIYDYTYFHKESKLSLKFENVFVNEI